MEIKNKVVIVTGASKGIGLALSRLIFKKGAKVVLAGRSQDLLEKIGKELGDSLVVPADMTKPEDIKNLVKKAVEKYGRVDILINNAGQGYDAPVEKIKAENFRRTFDLDLLGPILAMQEVIPLMRKQGGGMIVNISSATALMHLPEMSPYASLKSALALVSRTAREELKKDNITVSVAYPYITLTDFEKNTIRDSVKTTAEEAETSGPYPADTAEYTAETILKGMEKEEEEIFGHDWMTKMRN